MPKYLSKNKRGPAEFESQKPDQSYRLICVSHKANANKFWFADVYGRWVVRHWGRVGYAGTKEVYEYADQWTATNDTHNQALKKSDPWRGEGKTYKALELLDETDHKTLSTHVPTDQLDKLGIKINGDSTLKDLVRYLIATNVHTITANTQIVLNAKGQLATPLGVINNRAIAEAKRILLSIGGLLTKGHKHTTGYHDSVARYMALVPTDVGMKFNPADLFSSDRDIEAQEELLDAMASVVVEEITEQAFDVTLEPVDDQTERRIKAMYQKTASSGHQSYGKRIKRVWRLRIEQMAEAYQKRALSNERLLWHGTRAANLLSILHKGMIITRSYTNGRAFGDGLYFADCSTKAANYSTGYWSGTDSRSFVLLSAVKLGRSFEPTTSPYKTLPRGYDSMHAKAGKVSYLINNEIIIYQTDQADPRFLVELA